MRVLLAIGLVVLLLPVVQAHGAAAPRPQDTRLVHDHNDDCGGDGVTSNCRGTIDLIALDVQELYDGGDQVNFRFTLDKGQAGSHKLTLSYDSPSGRKTFETTTTDQSKFTGGFDKLAVSSAGDGTRYWLDATLASDKAGVTGKISNFRVEARRDNTLGDFMPGGYQSPIGPVDNPNQGDGPTNYVKPDYTGRGASYYVFITAPNAKGNNGKASTSFAVQNLLDTPQTVRLTVSSEGAQASFGGATEKVVDVPRKGSQDIQVDIDGTGDGRFTLTATTNLGGRTVRDGTYSITAATEPAPTNDGTTTPPAEDDSQGAPGIPLVLTALALLIAAARRR